MFLLGVALGFIAAVLVAVVLAARDGRPFGDPHDVWGDDE